MNTQKIAFSGIGAVGGYYGGIMANYYQDSNVVNVYFISRGTNLEKIQRDGLWIQTIYKKTHAIPLIATNNPNEIGPVDYLFCCTKSYDLEKNIQELSPLIGKETIIIPLLNGANISDRIQQLLPHNQIWEGCVYIGARLKTPGVIEKFSEKDRIFFGSNEGDKERQKELLQLLLDAGINAFNPEDIEFRIWKKFFMISTAATITSYYNLPIDEVITQHEETFISLGNELKLVAERMNINLPEDIVHSSIEAQRMMPKGATTSMHSDFINGKQTELETLTGYVVNMAEQLHINTPTYRSMYTKLKNLPYPVQ